MNDEVKRALLVDALVDGLPASAGAAEPSDEVLRHRRLAILLQAEARGRIPQRTAEMVGALIADLPAARRAAAVSAVRRRLRPRRPATTWRWLAAAALIVGIVGMWFATRPPAPSAQMTVLACSGTALLQPGRTVVAGEALQLPEGSTAMLGLADGSQLEATGPLQLVSELTGQSISLMLHAGNLRVAAKPQRPEAPLRLRSPHADIAVVGTAFLLTVGPAGTRLQVDEGSVQFTPRDGVMRLVAAGAEARAWPAPRLSADFEDGRVPAEPPAWRGKLVAGPARDRNRFCLEGVLYSERFQCFGVMVEDWDRSRPGLFAYRRGTRLSCRLWIAPGKGNWALIVGCEGQSGEVEHSLQDLPRGVWTTLEVDLGTLPPWHPDRAQHLRLQEGDWVRDLRFQCDVMPGLEIYLDDLRIVAPDSP